MVDDMGQQSAGGSPTSDATAGVPQAGDVVGGKFVVERVVGIGGMGVVVAAHHKHLEQTVAIKFLRRDAAKDEMAVNRFLREARAAITLQSEHVVRVMDAGRLDDGLPYLVMEYLSGQDLDQVLAQRGRLPLAEAVEYLLQSMEAVADAHAAGIVHRDLKPSNLFLTIRPDGSPHVKVLDFGISKAFDVTGVKQPSLTVTSMTLGSPLYMSPEQVRSSKTVDARTDVWALGVIAYELLAGIQPFEAETVTSLCAKIVADDPPSLRSIRPDVPAEFEAVVLKCLEKNPASRYQSVIQLATALRPFASADGLASVARIVRSGGLLKPTLASAPERASQPSGHAVTPVKFDSGSQPTQSDAAHAETVASWQETGDRRGRQVKRAGALTAAALAMLAFVIIAVKWPRTAPAPSGAAQPTVSAASVVAQPPVAAPLPAAATLPVAPAESTIPPAASADEKRSEPAAEAKAAPAAHVAATPPPKRPTAVKASAGGAISTKSADDLLLDRK
jgi:serine/threonine-protein kinase